MRILSAAALLLSGAATLTVLPAASQAAPLGSATLARQAAAGSIVEQAARRCWWRNGERRCGRIGNRDHDYRPDGNGYGFTYGNPKAEAYPTGTREWWNAMEREGRTGNPRG